MKRCLPLVLLCLAISQPVFAIEPIPEPPLRSTGFSDPSDIEPLLSYRLPDWGYHLWDLDLDLSAHGFEANASENSIWSFQSSPKSNFQLFRESEDRSWRLATSLLGGYSRRNEERDWNDDALESSRLNADLTVSGELRDYFSDSMFALLGGSSRVGFDESWNQEGDASTRSVRRQFHGSVEAGVGVGRQRDVTPLLQAQRISERLTALGRPPLPSSEVQRLARIIARQGGYRFVYQREDKYLWGEVLGGLAGEQAFTPFELLFLREVLGETIGARSEGWRAEFTGSASRTSSIYDRSIAGPQASLSLIHNTSLNHQWSASAAIRYQWTVDHPGDDEAGVVTLNMGHLWVVADRALWSNTLSGQLDYGEDEDSARRFQIVGLRTRFEYFVEDSVALRPELGLRYSNAEYSGGSSYSEWRWDVGFSMTYLLDRWLG